jgi:hypothetical protein
MHGCCKGVSLLILESYNECQYSSKVMGIIMHISVTYAVDPSVNKTLTIQVKCEKLLKFLN